MWPATRPDQPLAPAAHEGLNFRTEKQRVRGSNGQCHDGQGERKIGVALASRPQGHYRQPRDEDERKPGSRRVDRSHLYDG
jgi:hypothetical protein